MFCSYQKKTHIADIEVVLLLAIGRPLSVELVKCQLQLAFRCLAQVLIRKVIKYHKKHLQCTLPPPSHTQLTVIFQVHFWFFGYLDG